MSLLPLKLLSVDSTIKAFYDAYIEARNSGDVIMLPSFYSEKSREKVNQLIKNNMYELGEKYDSRRRYNNTILLGMVSLDPIYIIVEQVNPRKDEYYYKYTIIIKDSQGNPQIVNVLFESFLDDLLRQYGITPQFL